jgi:hypothetical protein
MNDIQITEDSKRGIAHIEGLSDAGIDFIDGYNTGEFQVVDSGRIIIRLRDQPVFTERAAKAGLTVEVEQ